MLMLMVRPHLQPSTFADSMAETIRTGGLSINVKNRRQGQISVGLFHFGVACKAVDPAWPLRSVNPA
jgi:hypothetical protein